MSHACQNVASDLVGGAGSGSQLFDVRFDGRIDLGRGVVETEVAQQHGRSSVIEIAGQVPGDEIRGPRVNEHVSRFAAVPAVRRFLLAYQRSQAQVARTGGFRGLVMEGRDIGSVIFPEADFRFFLHADPVERARRRAAEGQTDSIAERDRLDAARKTAPFVCPAGATPIDSTHMTLPQVVDHLAASIAPRLGASQP